MVTKHWCRANYYFMFFFGIFFSCQELPEEFLSEVSKEEFNTKKVIILVIDGPRLSETWALPEKKYIPYQAYYMAPKGVFFSNFYNDGQTYTLPGHTAITTGHHVKIKNNGNELPVYPSVFQRFLKFYQYSPDSTLLVSSKEKLHVLADCSNLDWRYSYVPEVYTENREDEITFRLAKRLLTDNQPVLSMIHFRGPDKAGHANDWNQYLANIQQTDALAYELWEFINTNKHFKDKTTLFITWDHGRHLDEIANGFIGHGDNCEGCRHIAMLALGPDFKTNSIIDKHYNQTDIAPTIAKILHFPFQGEGKVITEIFK